MQVERTRGRSASGRERAGGRRRERPAVPARAGRRPARARRPGSGCACWRRGRPLRRRDRRRCPDGCGRAGSDDRGRARPAPQRHQPGARTRASPAGSRPVAASVSHQPRRARGRAADPGRPLPRRASRLAICGRDRATRASWRVHRRLRRLRAASCGVRAASSRWRPSTSAAPSRSSSSTRPPWRRSRRSAPRASGSPRAGRSTLNSRSMRSSSRSSSSKLLERAREDLRRAVDVPVRTGRRAPGTRGCRAAIRARRAPALADLAGSP